MFFSHKLSQKQCRHAIVAAGFGLLGLLILFAGRVARAQEPPALDKATGFVLDADTPMVIAQCTSCHSSKLVLQYRADADGWRELLVWMREEQGMWEMPPEVETRVVNYLARYYKPDTNKRRRKALAAPKPANKKDKKPAKQ